MQLSSYIRMFHLRPVYASIWNDDKLITSLFSCVPKVDGQYLIIDGNFNLRLLNRLFFFLILRQYPNQLKSLTHVTYFRVRSAKYLLIRHAFILFFHMFIIHILGFIYFFSWIIFFCQKVAHVCITVLPFQTTSPISIWHFLET